jgi:hypothetical protein
MVAPLPQERDYKREFDQTRLAAIRGDVLSFPRIDNEEEVVQQTGGGLPDLAPRVFARDSEDGLLTQLASARAPALNASYEEAIPDPSAFSFLQQQARMAEGIGAPEFLAPETAALPDPEYSTEDETVTFGESLAAASEQFQEANSVEDAQQAQAAFKQKMQQAMDAKLEKLRELIKEKTSRWTAKGIGNGSNAVDSVGWDGWITFTLTYIYLMARGFITVFVPKPTNMEDDGMAGYAVKKGLHVIIPEYRPLMEPWDFLYFLFLLVISVIIVVILIAAIVLFINIAAVPFFAANPSPT